MSINIGIDLGTSSVLVYKTGKGVIINEPSTVVFDKSTNRIISVGDETKNVVGRTPGNLVAIKPMQNGVISDFAMTEKMLRYFINKSVGKRSWVRPRVCITVPANVTDMEKRAVEDAAIQAGARDVLILENTIASATGLGIDINQPVGTMIVDIGGGTTDISVISLGGSVISSSLRIAGEEFDKAIARYIRKRFNLLIGLATAEEIKKDVGSVVRRNIPSYMEIRGRDIMNGLPVTINISSNDVYEALRELTEMIINEIHFVLEKTPPELAADITYRGIILTGGGSQIKGFDELIEEKLGIMAIMADNPITLAAEGTGKYIEKYKG